VNDTFGTWQSDDDPADLIAHHSLCEKLRLDVAAMRPSGSSPSGSRTRSIADDATQWCAKAFVVEKPELARCQKPFRTNWESNALKRSLRWREYALPPPPEFVLRPVLTPEQQHELAERRRALEMGYFLDLYEARKKQLDPDQFERWRELPRISVMLKQIPKAVQ
jgi:hypothetical protein